MTVSRPTSPRRSAPPPLTSSVTDDLALLQRAAGAAMYAGKHTGAAVLADRSHTTVASINGRRAGRPGTTSLGAVA
ncbi:hypothetical protein [Streptomyces decoyicus]|uniref:hypothetical protein n=1 Tax=Streptomyces decoyicus TaxID=249567 RepID=UPI0038005AB8